MNVGREFIVHVFSPRNEEERTSLFTQLFQIDTFISSARKQYGKLYSFSSGALSVLGQIQRRIFLSIVNSSLVS